MNDKVKESELFVKLVQNKLKKHKSAHSMALELLGKRESSESASAG